MVLEKMYIFLQRKFKQIRFCYNIIQEKLYLKDYHRLFILYKL